MAELSERAYKAYRNLVYETPGFTDYFFAATPIAEIAELNLGSRPASRKSTRRIEDLRAIPWGFSWGQCRLLLPGWYGFGAAVSGWLGQRRQAEERLALLQEMFRSGPSSPPCCRTWTWCWPRPTWRSPRATPSWCRTWNCASASSSASRPSTARRCAAWSGHRQQRAPGRQPAAGALDPEPLRLPRSAEPLAGGADQAHRALSRDPEQVDPRVHRGIHLSINGVAAGLRNTG
jgi:phosphoenolpyruvate carboxylase